MLHALVLVSVRGLQPTVNPRGWQAAKEAERHAAAAAVPTVQQRRQRGRPKPSLEDILGTGRVQADTGRSNGDNLGVAALPQAALQQTCSLSGLPEQATLQAAARRRLVATTTAAFVLGLLCGALLHAGLRRWWLQRRGRLGRTAAELPSAAGSCAVALEQQLAPAGAVEAAPASSKPAALSASEAAKAVEAAGSTLAAAATAARVAGAEENGMEEEEEQGAGSTFTLKGGTADAEEQPAAAEAAVAAAVQELVLLQSASGGSTGSAPAADAGSPCDAAAPSTQKQQLELSHGLEAQQELGGGGAAPLAVAAVARAGALSTLRPDDQADVAAAAQLVLTMCRSMHVDPGQLSRGERLQLIYTMLQAWQAQQARRHAEQMHRWVASRALGGRRW